MFKRGFTLPDPSLLRCNLFSLLLALEFVATNVKNKLLWPHIIFVVKHSSTYRLVTDASIRKRVELKSNTWPRHLIHNRRFLERIITLHTMLGSQLTLVEPSRNDDSNLEFYVNCDQDPLSEENKEHEPENKEEFDRMMRIARQHKQGMADLLDVGGHTYAKKFKCRPKNEQRIPAPAIDRHPSHTEQQPPQQPQPQCARRAPLMKQGDEHPCEHPSPLSQQARLVVPASLQFLEVNGDDDHACSHVPEHVIVGDTGMTSNTTNSIEALAQSLLMEQQE
jgi:hypothetical protein